MEQTYSCPEQGCSASGMNMAELVAHAVTHGTAKSSYKLADDPNARNQRKQGREPGK